jgi:hypothetical protein
VVRVPPLDLEGFLPFHPRFEGALDHGALAGHDAQRRDASRADQPRQQAARRRDVRPGALLQQRLP